MGVVGVVLWSPVYAEDDLLLTPLGMAPGLSLCTLHSCQLWKEEAQNLSLTHKD